MAHSIFNPESNVAVDYHAMPYAIFASPQVAAVGQTEQEARQAGLTFVTNAYGYYDTAYG